jgi:hypothetical protein
MNATQKTNTSQKMNNLQKILDKVDDITLDDDEFNKTMVDQRKILCNIKNLLNKNSKEHCRLAPNPSHKEILEMIKIYQKKHNKKQVPINPNYPIILGTRKNLIQL